MRAASSPPGKGITPRGSAAIVTSASVRPTADGGGREPRLRKPSGSFARASAVGSGNEPLGGVRSGARIEHLLSTLLRKGVNTSGTSERSTRKGSSLFSYSVPPQTGLNCATPAGSAERSAASTLSSSLVTCSWQRMVVVSAGAPSSRCAISDGRSSSGLPTPTSRSEPTARSRVRRSATDSRRNLARKEPVFGEPRRVVPKCRGSKM